MGKAPSSRDSPRSHSNRDFVGIVSFIWIKDIANHSDKAELTSAIIAMAHGLKLKVIAEGVETAEQLTFLRSQGCDASAGLPIQSACRC